jgi:acetate kinase
MKVLVLNCGSSTLKFQVIETQSVGTGAGKDEKLARGLIDRIGEKATCTFEAAGSGPHRETVLVRNYDEAVGKVLAWLDSSPATAILGLGAVGHRVVHGGDRFSASVLIDNEVVETIEALNDLAPLHNPACVSGIRAARSALDPSIPMVAAFDTSFHHTLPEYAATYALPHELSLRHKIRRYGFHGLAHRYSTLRYAEIAAMPTDRVNIVTLHLGNGCSASAVRGGRSVDTSMGFTPLEGLVMGTRSGDLDPAVVGYLCRREDVPVAEVGTWLNTRSGLLGVSGRSGDMRDLLEHCGDDARARLAIEVFCYRTRKYLGAYLAVLGGADAVIFSGGIGENSAWIRAKILSGMEWCGLELDGERNAAVVAAEGRISLSQSRIHAYVIATDEEALIARDTASIVERIKP